MLNQLLVGVAVSLVNVAIHASVMMLAIRFRQAHAVRGVPGTSRHVLMAVISTVLVLMAAHFGEIYVWSLTYYIVDAAPPGTDLGYFAFVNYTTLGYGDVVPVVEWQLLGPMAAMNGILLSGWSTAVILEALRRSMATEGHRQVV